MSTLYPGTGSRRWLELPNLPTPVPLARRHGAIRVGNSGGPDALRKPFNPINRSQRDAAGSCRTAYIMLVRFGAKYRQSPVSRTPSAREKFTLSPYRSDTRCQLRFLTKLYARNPCVSLCDVLRGSVSSEGHGGYKGW